jgi:glycosyltransferase involved in cell wall biosynthesis
MKLTYLSSPISSQYGGGEKFLDDFTSGINTEHKFIGSSKAVYSLFQSKGYKTTLTSGLFEPVSPLNFLLFPISILVGLYQFIKFYKTFKESGWIISPTAHCETFFVIPWIKLFLGTPVLFMVHAPKVPKLFSIPPLNWVLSKCWGSSPVVFVSQSQKELWNSVGCASPNQKVIYNGVKVGELSGKKSQITNNILGLELPLDKGLAAQADWGYKIDTLSNTKEAIKIGFLARLHQEKSCDVLIKALSSIKSTQDIEIIIAGDGPEKDTLTALYEVQKLPDNVKVNFVGFQSDTNAFYETLDLFVFPSRRESFGLVICEAMERGVSVLCSNIPSSLEVKGALGMAGESELIFEKDNAEKLAAKIDYFIENQKTYLSTEYKLRLHNAIVENFSLDRMIDEYNRILEV